MDYVLDMFDSLGDGLDGFTREQGVHKSPEKLTKETAAYEYDIDLMMIVIVVMILLLMMSMVICCAFVRNKRRKAFCQADQTKVLQTSFHYIDFRKGANLV